MKDRKTEKEYQIENRYELIVNLDKETKRIYQKHFESEDYQFLVKKETLLFVKKQKEIAKNRKHENDIVQLVLNITKKYSHVGILYIDLTNEMNEILPKSEKVEKFNVTDNYITLPIKKAFEQAILNKNLG